ncbi:ABC transporter substrate-binding protein, partial [Brevibacterium sp. UCMA 11754]|uniref:ABC transporter substrate-binding protein n=1 Tax=Brevibacterium sp. UCMA 11754 TaxID=2749198 RepID=UPI001F323F4B
MKRRTTSALVASVGALALVLSACEAPDGGDSQLVIGTEDLGGYNPVNGYSVDGNSPFYDGLLRLQEDPGTGQMPDLTPALAAAEPKANEDSSAWTVKLREGVTFSDDSAFDAQDVAATYRAIIDPDSASEVVDAFRMIEDIETPDESTVVFRLSEPTPTFASRLDLGSCPARPSKGHSGRRWSVNSEPVGTGAYVLESLTSDT